MFSWLDTYRQIVAECCQLWVEENSADYEDFFFFLLVLWAGVLFS